MTFIASATGAGRSHGPAPAARRRRRLAALLLLPAALLLSVAACSSSDAPDGTAAAPRVAEPPKIEGAEDLSRKPVAEAGRGAAPAELLTLDLVTGDGAVATATDTVTIQYVGTIWKSGKQFDSSWDRGEPDTFPLEATVPGFAQGIDGMKEGGRRVIVIPPDLGYGPMGGAPPDIAADDTLVFVVDLLKVVEEDPSGGAAGIHESGAPGADTGSAEE